jgi:hypothetical protein
VSKVHPFEGIILPKFFVITRVRIALLQTLSPSRSKEQVQGVTVKKPVRRGANESIVRAYKYL